MHEDDVGIGNLEKMKNKLLDCSENTIRRCKHLWFANVQGQPSKKLNMVKEWMPRVIQMDMKVYKMRSGK